MQKAFIRQSIDYGCLVRQVAQRIKEKVYHCAIDAKDTRHTGQCLKGRDNYKSIHVVFQKMLLYSAPTHNENHWVKHYFKPFIESFKYHPLFQGHSFILTADCLYNTRANRQVVEANGCYYLWPLKSQYKQFGHLFARKRHVRSETHTRCNKNCIFHYDMSLYRLPHNPENLRFLMAINKTTFDNKTQQTTTVVQNYITNYHDPDYDYFGTKLAHWDVETFHQLKDVWLHEDRCHKAKQNAFAYSITNNLLAFGYHFFGISQKNQLKTFASELLDAIVAFLLFICATLLIEFYMKWFKTDLIKACFGKTDFY